MIRLFILCFWQEKEITFPKTSEKLRHSIAWAQVNKQLNTQAPNTHARTCKCVEKEHAHVWIESDSQQATELRVVFFFVICVCLWVCVCVCVWVWIQFWNRWTSNVKTKLNETKHKNKSQLSQKQIRLNIKWLKWLKCATNTHTHNLMCTI